MNYPRIILIVLCIAAALLYARVLLPPESSESVSTQQQTSKQTDRKLHPLPPEQMELVIQTLAPEMAAGQKE